MIKSPIKFYSTRWCGDCFRAKRAFQRYGVPLEEIDIDLDTTAREFVRQTNRGMLSVPTIVFPDETVMTEPTASELESKFRELGLVP